MSSRPGTSGAHRSRRSSTCAPTACEVVGGPTTDAGEHDAYLREVLACEPDLILDNGGDLFVRYLEAPYSHLLGGTEETTSGRMRLAPLREQISRPVLVINDSPIKQFAENYHAVGQSVLESFLRITNRMTNGRRVVVFGYGSCGKGVAVNFQQRLRQRLRSRARSPETAGGAPGRVRRARALRGARRGGRRHHRHRCPRRRSPLRTWRFCATASSSPMRVTSRPRSPRVEMKTDPSVKSKAPGRGSKRSSWTTAAASIFSAAATWST